ncbi:MAG: hypothetical protein KJP02_01350, partial [Octadecabacter sp.]|nr:hypothetical protein [Octadecabacter sp.]
MANYEFQVWKLDFNHRDLEGRNDFWYDYQGSDPDILTSNNLVDQGASDTLGVQDEDLDEFLDDDTESFGAVSTATTASHGLDVAGERVQAFSEVIIQGGGQTLRLTMFTTDDDAPPFGQVFPGNDESSGFNATSYYTITDASKDFFFNGDGTTNELTLQSNTKYDIIQVNEFAPIRYFEDVPPDGIVEGTVGDDLIDAAYTGDPEGDLVDA